MFNYPPNLSDAVCEVYKSIDGFDLNIWRYEPEATGQGSRSAILFFFGGGFRMGSPEQFASQARHLAKRGMIVLIADYRVSSRHGVKAISCLEDAKSALLWVQSNAKRLGIDPERIAAAGGSAGGYLAAATALVPGYDSGAGSLRAPNALVLFNPGVVMAPVPGMEFKAGWADSITDRMGAEPESLSPYHHAIAGAPPTIIFHGRGDTTIPFRTVELFAAKMNGLGNRCELVGYDNEEHGFFNVGRGDGSAYTDTVQRTDRFLASLGWLDEIGESQS